ncbi:hypothetical protein H1C71_008267, partial [Ictidomys tridecemlineatus]
PDPGDSGCNKKCCFLWLSILYPCPGFPAEGVLTWGRPHAGWQALLSGGSHLTQSPARVRTKQEQVKCLLWIFRPRFRCLGPIPAWAAGVSQGRPKRKGIVTSVCKGPTASPASDE